MSDLKNFLDLQHDYNKMRADYELALKKNWEGSSKILEQQSKIKELQGMLIKAIGMFEAAYEVLTIDDFHNYKDMIEAVQDALDYPYKADPEIERFLTEKERQLRGL